ncbi:E3 ubiquitin-protein ligase TRIM71-like [Mytilus edulis]|uniref:E3 ubiquitin-protein ligase TRIM71-like n=1 Tax=Mytilus edulis TaxID=6550 RepID=UPI0039F0A81B
MADSRYCIGCARGDEDKKAESWCCECTELVCKTCASVHERMSPPHKVVPMKDIQQLSSSLLRLSKNCENHPDQKIAMYCCQHDKVICDSCVPVSHQNCNAILSIENAARSVKDGTALFDIERRIDNLCQVTGDILSQREKTHVDLEKSRNKIRKQVSDIKQKVIARLDKLEAEIHKDIDSKYQHCTEIVLRNTNYIQSSSESLSTWRTDIKSLKQHVSEIHLFQVVKFLDAKTHEKELEIREIQTNIPILTYHLSESETNITKLVADFGTITVDHVQVPTPVLDIDQHGQFLVSNQRTLSLTSSLQTSKVGDGEGLDMCCFIPGYRLLLGQYNDRKLFVCSIDGFKTKVINVDFKLGGITLYQNNHALVSGAGVDGIQILDLTTLKPGRIIKVGGGDCRGITSVQDKIWVRNQRNTLTIVDINGKLLNTIQTTFDPFDICANKDGNVYCTDYDSNKVYVVTSDGKEHEIYNSPELVEPYGVAVDDRGDVYVAGSESDTIHRISNDGQKHNIVLTADDGINEPTGLSYNYETKELLVINNNLSYINIYKAQ